MRSKTVKVLLALILCPVVMLALSLMLPKRYTATMSLMLDQSIRVAQGDNPLSQIADQTSFTRPRSINTQIDELTGTEVLLDAFTRTAQQHPDAFNDQLKAEDRYTSLVNRLRIDNNKDSDIVDLRVTMDDPQLAADTANNIGQAYMDLNKKLAAAMGTGALASINDALTRKQEDLKQINNKIAAIQTKYHISDPAVVGGMQDKLQKDLEAQIQTTEAQYTGAVGEMSAARAALSSTPKYLPSDKSTQTNPKAINLDSQIAQTSSDLQALKGKFTDDYPQVKQLANKLADLKAERARTPDNLIARSDVTLNPNYMQFQNAYATAKAKVASLQNSLNTLKSSYAHTAAEGTAYPAAQRELAQLLLDKQSGEQQYALLLQQKQPLEVANGSARQAQAQIISVALAPSAPSFPNPKVFVLMGLAIGIVIAALIVMPKAPEVVYTPTIADALALQGSMRSSESALPNPESSLAPPLASSTKSD